MITNQKGNIVFLSALFIALVTGNILMLTMRHENLVGVLDKTEMKFLLKDFDTYIKNLIYNKRICSEIFEGQQLNNYATLPPFGDNLLGIEMASLQSWGSVIIQRDAPFDRNGTIVVRQIFLQFEQSPDDPNDNSNFTNVATLRIEVEVEGTSQVLSYPMIFDVSYEVGIQIMVPAALSKGEITQMLLDGDPTPPDPPTSNSCIGRIEEGNAGHHQIVDLSCDLTAFPTRACVATCKYLRRDENNRIARCL